MSKLITVIGGLLLAGSRLSATEVNLDLLKRMAADREKSNQFIADGKPLKANALWDQVNNKLQATYKSGSWYTLPSSCAAYRRQYSDRIHIECKIPDLAAKELTVPQIDLALLSSKLTMKWEDAENEVPYDIKFKVAKYRDTTFVPLKVGYVHTNIEGFTLYIDAFQILGKKKATEESTAAVQDDGTFKEKMQLMIREVSPMLQAIDTLPEKLPKPKSCYAPNDGVAKNALTEMEKLVKEKNLSLDASDLLKFGSFELCNMANQNKADDTCLDACMEKVFEAWR